MKLKKFYRECVRVLKITRKPTKKEFKRVFTVTGIGVLLIGMIGFLVAQIYNLMWYGYRK